MIYNSSWAGGDADSVSVVELSVEVVEGDSVVAEELELELVELVDGLTAFGAFGARLLIRRRTFDHQHRPLHSPSLSSWTRLTII